MDRVYHIVYNRHMKETLKFIFTVAIIVIPIRTFVAQPFIVSGVSMDPTLATGHYLIVDELSYRFTDPKRGDVIVLNYPKNPQEDYIKRIIGLPGETVDIKDGKVSIISATGSTTVLRDDFVDPKHQISDSSRTTLLDDEYFVMGDNRAQSSDSRSWGPLQKDLIIGRAIVRLYPFSKIDLFPGKINFE